MTAIFADGTTKKYTGHRAITAAWRIIRKSDGKEIKSGWSLDHSKAENSANSWVRDAAWSLIGEGTKFIGKYNTTARQRSEIREHNAGVIARARSAATIEIVAVA